MDDAEQVILNTNNFKPGASCLFTRAAVEVVVEEQHGQDIQRVEDVTERPARANVLKQSNCATRPHDTPKFRECRRRRLDRAEDERGEGRVERAVAEEESFRVGT